MWGDRYMGSPFPFLSDRNCPDFLCCLAALCGISPEQAGAGRCFQGALCRHLAAQYVPSLFLLHLCGVACALLVGCGLPATCSLFLVALHPDTV